LAEVIKMNLDYLFQQIIESEQQVHCRLISINEGIEHYTNL